MTVRQGNTLGPRGCDSQGIMNIMQQADLTVGWGGEQRTDWLCFHLFRGAAEGRLCLFRTLAPGGPEFGCHCEGQPSLQATFSRMSDLAALQTSHFIGCPPLSYTVQSVLHCPPRPTLAYTVHSVLHCQPCPTLSTLSYTGLHCPPCPTLSTPL